MFPQLPETKMNQPWAAALFLAIFAASLAAFFAVVVPIVRAADEQFPTNFATSHRSSTARRP
jgi:hypothetical protein